MKVFTPYDEIASYFARRHREDIQFVDTLDQASVLITGRFDASMVHPQLQSVIIPWTGHDWIDLEVLKTNGIDLYVTPTRSPYVAEKAVALTLALLGRVVEYHNRLATGDWANRNSKDRIAWASLQDKRVGLYGFGRIGRLVHQFLQGFGCEQWTIDRGKDYPDSIQTVPHLDALIDRCDVIIISTPLNATTEGIFNQERLSHMSKKYLINVGRGKIVEEHALYQALIDGTLAGYASDVWYQYPKNDDHRFPSSLPIHTLPNVVLSNHSGGEVTDILTQVYQDLEAHLERLLQGDRSERLDLDSMS
jgi:formate dehydrogenase